MISKEEEVGWRGMEGTPNSREGPQKFMKTRIASRESPGALVTMLSGQSKVPDSAMIHRLT